MLDLILLSLLPGGEDLLAPFVGEQDGPVFFAAKVMGADLLAIDEGEREAVGERGAKLLHQVEGKSLPTRAIAMEVPHGGVEPVRGERSGGVETKQGVEVGEQGVDSIEWWATVAVAKGEHFSLLRDQVAEDGEILSGSLAFQATNLIESPRCGEGSEAMSQGIGDGFERLGLEGVFACGPAQDVPAVGDLARDESAGERGTRLRVIREAVLRAAQKHVAGGRADDIREMSPVFGEERDRDAGIGAGAEEEGRAEDVAEANHAAEVEQRQAQAYLFFHFDHDGFAFLAQVGTLGGDVEGVEEAFQCGAVSWNLRSQI